MDVWYENCGMIVLPALYTYNIHYSYHFYIMHTLSYYIFS